MEIVEDRYGVGLTLIASQLPVEAWREAIGEPTFADAILDRIIHNTQPSRAGTKQVLFQPSPLAGEGKVCSATGGLRVGARVNSYAGCASFEAGSQ